jgi:hypothetical protein
MSESDKQMFLAFFPHIPYFLLTRADDSVIVCTQA